MSPPIKSFRDFKLNKQLVNATLDLGWEEPSEIQCKAIPLALNGHDIMGIAQTGTGKTAAFMLPILMKVKYAQEKGPRALVLAPTRELAVQIEEMSIDLARYTDLRIAAIYGGLGPKKQIELLEAGIDILIATPGRFTDLYLKGFINTRFIKTMVLDEADRMMDMGFMPQIRKILEVIPVKRQNLLFSATMPSKVVELSHEFLDFPEMVEISPQGTAVDTVDQVLYYLPNMRSKLNFLEYLLDSDEVPVERAVVFVRKRSTAQNIFKYLERKDHGEVRVLHANKGQKSRLNALRAFKEGSVRLLVTTDISSRGIDVEDVSHVINFDVPIIYEDYVHRIGRTGRARRSGRAITFCTDSEKYHIRKIEEVIREKIPVRQVPHEVVITETPFAEKQEMAREVDRQKRREDPNFKGAFHEKKQKKGAEQQRDRRKGKK